MSGRRWDAWGLAGGLALGLLDMVGYVALDADFTVDGRDLFLPMAAFTVASFGALGYMAGRVARDREIIRRQMRELEATQQQVVQNEKLAAIGRLAAGVAHEVRNPLGVIRASASMIQDAIHDDDDAYKACGFIRDEIDRLNGLISALLDFARPAELRTAPVSLEKVVDRALDLAAPEAESRGIAVERESDGAVPDVPGDRDLLVQVVSGLVVNAAQALERGGRIAVRLRRGGRGVQLEVADSGPGVAPADRERVFEPFFTTKARGTGLGLAMAARIVQAHHGELRVVPERGAGPEGAGACFRLELVA